MAKVRKENRVLTVDDQSIDYYLRDGYDHVEFNAESKEYDIVRPARNKLVPYEDLLKAQAKIKALEAEIASLKADKAKK